MEIGVATGDCKTNGLFAKYFKKPGDGLKNICVVNLSMKYMTEAEFNRHDAEVKRWFAEPDQHSPLTEENEKIGIKNMSIHKMITFEGLISVKTVTTKYILKNDKKIEIPVVFRRNCWNYKDIDENGGDRTGPPVDEQLPFGEDDENQRRLLDAEDTMRVDDANPTLR